MSRPVTNLSRYRQIISLRDVEKKTFEEIGKQLRITRQRAHEIYHRAIKKNSKILAMSSHGMTARKSA